MTQSSKYKLIELAPNDEIINLLNNYETLIEGNNALQLKPIPEFKPIIISSKDKVIPFQTKSQELADKVHQTAVQLNEHYDRVANEDERFIPYWNGDTTFSEEVKQFENLKKRNFFESYKNFLERNNAEGMIELGSVLGYLSPFYDNDYISLDSKTLKKYIYNSAGGLFISIPSLTLILAGTTLQSVPAGTGGITMKFAMLALLYGGSVALTFGSSLVTRINELKGLEYLNKEMIKDSEKADGIVSLIKSLS